MHKGKWAESYQIRRLKDRDRRTEASKTRNKWGNLQKFMEREEDVNGQGQIEDVRPVQREFQNKTGEKWEIVIEHAQSMCMPWASR